LAENARRIPAAPLYAPPPVVTNERNRFAAAAASKQAKLPLQAIMLELGGRSTAPAADTAAHWAMEEAGPEAVPLVMPSDQRIGAAATFLSPAEAGLKAVKAGLLVTFGVKASHRKPVGGHTLARLLIPRLLLAFATIGYARVTSSKASYCATLG
jgi:mannose-1-phosphate guanylyltransferase